MPMTDQFHLHQIVRPNTYYAVVYVKWTHVIQLQCRTVNFVTLISVIIVNVYNLSSRISCMT